MFGFWYFDNGCSHHITIDKSFFTDLSIVNDGLVTFGNGSKVMIYGKDIINASRILELKDVLFMNGH